MFLRVQYTDPPPTKIDDISVEDFRSLLDFNLVSYFFTMKVGHCW